MAKKQKRKVTQSAAVSTSARSTSGRSTNEFNPDYAYVVQDLKRIGILAVAFTGILVALSFILN